ncbi:uncharacterized protein METZ01_LOCUS445620 [marine metagenome]|uniref:Uncharacterized protein n=1 Tax=marine metagenome TaxID=408172 RepID=A0A382ZB70_9ZZZZ
MYNIISNTRTILLGPSHTRLVEKDKSYWKIKFRELRDKYDYLDKCICSCNIVVWIKQKLN